MILKTLKMTGWRNYTGEEKEFSPGINLFLGHNGQGKTNLLEAIFFLACGLSPRTAKIDEIINWKSNYFFIRGQFVQGANNTTVEMGGTRDGRRVNKIDGVPVRRLSEVSEQVNAVFFMPEDLYLVKGDPAKRRRFMDMEISQISTKYRHSIQNYKKFLRQRNALLKSKEQDKILMEVLTEKLADLTGPITKIRKKFIQKLSILARLRHRKLSGNQEELNLEYQGSIDPCLSPAAVLESFHSAKDMDQRYRTTTVGPHRDDFSFLVNSSDLKIFGSQGQQRTAVLSLKLAEIELFKAETDRYPLLLLDDVFSELDEQRKNMLLDYLSGRVQTFISSAECLSSPSEVRKYWIHEGSIRERK